MSAPNKVFSDIVWDSKFISPQVSHLVEKSASVDKFFGYDRYDAIFVDGIDMKATVPGGSPGTRFKMRDDGSREFGQEGSYLSKNFVGPGFPGENKSIAWSGDLGNEDEQRSVVNSLKSLIKENKGKKINIVAHSQGSVIAYHALKEIKEAGQDVAIDNFITMGSPLGGDKRKKWGDIAPENSGGQLVGRVKESDMLKPTELGVKEWTNIHLKNDPIGRDINVPGVKNIKLGKTSFSLDTENKTFWAHSTYKDPNVVTGVKAILNEKSYSWPTVVNQESIRETANLRLASLREAKQVASNAASRNFTANQQANFNGNLSLQTNQIITSNAVSTPATIQPQQAAAKQIDLDNVYMKQASDLLVSTNVDFTESFSGTYDSTGPNPTTSATWDASYTGSRAGTLAGSYTGTASGNVTYTNPTAPAGAGVAFTGTMTGNVVGYQDVQVRGNATYAWTDASNNTGTITGTIILRPGGGAANEGTLSGPVKNNAGTTIGTNTGTVINNVAN